MKIIIKIVDIGYRINLIEFIILIGIFFVFLLEILLFKVIVLKIKRV